MPLEREAVYHAGARFFEDGGKVMFEYRPDASTVIGPRVAKKADREAHAIEWRAFNAGRLPQLDHDGDGHPGGHAPIRPVSDEHKHVPADYETPKRRGRPKKVV